MSTFCGSAILLKAGVLAYGASCARSFHARISPLPGVCVYSTDRALTSVCVVRVRMNATSARGPPPAPFYGKMDAHSLASLN